MKANSVFLFSIAVWAITTLGLSQAKEGHHDSGEISAPKLLKWPVPPYTQEAKKAGIEGHVILEGVITPEGMVKDVKIFKGLGYGLDESAIETVTKYWRFRPAMANGEPITSKKIYLQISFNLLDKESSLTESLPAETVPLNRLKIEGNDSLNEEQFWAALQEKLGAAGVIRKRDVEDVIMRVYRAHGYQQASASWLSDDVLCIREGKQFHLGKLEILNAPVFPVDYLLSLFDLKTGDIFDSFKIQEEMEKIFQVYRAIGLVNWSFSSEQEYRLDAGEIDLTLTFQESKHGSEEIMKQ